MRREIRRGGEAALVQLARMGVESHDIVSVLARLFGDGKLALARDPIAVVTQQTVTLRRRGDLRVAC